MKWPVVKISKVRNAIGTRDPRRTPDAFFKYVDISGIDRESKTISTATAYIGSDAPGRARQEILSNDILVSTVRPNLNAVAMVPPELDGEIASTGFCVLRANLKAILPKFLFYFTQTQPFIESLLAQMRGANYPAVTDRNVYECKIPLPPFSEQRKIVEILDQADALRRKGKEADDKASRILTALFYKMFGDPATNPMGWKVEILKDAFSLIGGGTPSKNNPAFWEGTIPWVSPKDMKGKEIFDTIDHISEQALQNSSTNLAREKSVLIVYRSGILAHSFPCAIARKTVALNQDMKALYPKNDEYEPSFIFGWLQAAFPIVMACVKKGATVQNVDGNRFQGLKVIKPPKELQHAFDRALVDILESEKSREAQGYKVQLLFSTLLHRAFAGALTAGWREKNSAKLEAELSAQLKAIEGENTINRKSRDTTRESARKA